MTPFSAGNSFLVVRGPFRLAFLAAAFLVGSADAGDDKLERIRVSKDGKGFVLERSGKPFVPWGFNYDHDDKGDLLEDYWAEDWDRMAEDFREMKALGANVVRIHLQVAKFLEAPDRAHETNLARLAKLLDLAERTGLYLDVTGLGCYHKQDVPPWFDALDEQGRWRAQAFFWEKVAARCAGRPVVFCYDLMNEPVVPGGKRKAGDWLGPGFGGKHFVQVISLDQAKRPRPEVAAAWVKQLVAAVRKHDTTTLITVGLVPWSLDRPGITSGFVPEKIAPHLDFIAVHLYPEKGKVDEALATLKGFAVGKPVVIEETFPLKCGLEDFGRFRKESVRHAAGWIGFYWGKTEAECRNSGTLRDALMAAWLEWFRKNGPK